MSRLWWRIRTEPPGCCVSATTYPTNSRPIRTEVRVYPDIYQLARYTMLARRDRLSTIGVRRSRRLGTDNEFERLRDYTEGDEPRHMDWRATARRRKLTCRAFQLNQSQ